MQEGCDILAFYVMVPIGVALMQKGCDILAFYVMVSIGVALMQGGCDIIDLLCCVNRSGSYAGRL